MIYLLIILMVITIIYFEFKISNLKEKIKRKTDIEFFGERTKNIREDLINHKEIIELILKNLNLELVKEIAIGPIGFETELRKIKKEKKLTVTKFNIKKEINKVKKALKK